MQHVSNIIIRFTKSKLNDVVAARAVQLARTAVMAGMIAPHLPADWPHSPAFLVHSRGECAIWATSMLPVCYRLPKRMLGLPQGVRCALHLCSRNAWAPPIYDELLQPGISLDRCHGVPVSVLPGRVCADPHSGDRSNRRAIFLRHNDAGAV